MARTAEKEISAVAVVVSSMSSKAARLLSLSDIDEAAEVMSAAFRDDPFWAYLIPNRERRIRDLPRFFRVLLRFQFASAQLYGVSDPLEGVAVWSFPGSPGRSFWDLVGSGMLWSMVRFLFSPRALPILRSWRVFSRFGEMHRRYAPSPHYYLESVGVTPDSQGRGLASKLIRPILRRADEESVCVYTETVTPQNVPIYVHLGFEVRERWDLPGSGISLWALHRPPRGRARETDRPR